MKIDYGLILCAGVGSRMGELSEHIPKALLPVFEKRLFDLQYNYAKKLGCEKIFANIHFLPEIVINYISKNYPDVELLIEENLLGQGGAIHNLGSKVDYKGSCLMLNCDQFLFFDNELINYLEDLKKYPAILFSINVNKSGKYNKIILKDEKLIGIEKFHQEIEDDYYTFSGLSLINLELIGKSSEFSLFFETVANFKENEIKVQELENWEYWDFGTKDKYIESIYKVLDNEKNKKFLNYFQKKSIFRSEKNYLEGNTINFSNKSFKPEKSGKSIILDSMKKAGHQITIFSD